MGAKRPPPGSQRRVEILRREGCKRPGETTHLCGKVMKPNSAIQGAVAGRLPSRSLSRGLLSRQALGGTRLRVSETARDAPPQRSAQKGRHPAKPEPSGATNKASTALPSPAAALDQTGKEDMKSFISEKLSSVELDNFGDHHLPAPRSRPPQARLKGGSWQGNTTLKARQTSKEVHHADSSAQRL